LSSSRERRFANFKKLCPDKTSAGAKGNAIAGPSEVRKYIG